MISDRASGQVQPVSIDGEPGYAIEFSFCSLVTKPAQYHAMVQSMVDAGFSENFAEFLYLDNSSGNRGDGYSGLNRLANHARGRFIVFCHQDVLAIDGIDRLREVISDVSLQDPSWAVLGNAGLRGHNRFLFLNEHGTIFAAPKRESPELVDSLDENFIVMRQDARLGFSNDLSGFHFYGTDLVTQARLRGYNSYVVDFRVEHFGKGTIDQSFHESCDQLERKYAEALSPRSVLTTCTSLDVGTLQGDGRKRRLTYFDRGGEDFVRPSKQIKKLIRARIAQNTHDIEGIRFQHPQQIDYATYEDMRKGRYDKHKWNLIREYLPKDIPVVELGAAFGVMAGLINRRLGAGQKQVCVEVATNLVDICRENALRGGRDRDLGIVNREISYAEASRSAGNRFSVPAMTLAQLLVDQGIDSSYSLICDIGGMEFDLLSLDDDALKHCRMIIVEMHPASYYARGETISSALGALTTAGFVIRANEATMIAAERSDDPISDAPRFD